MRERQAIVAALGRRRTVETAPLLVLFFLVVAGCNQMNLYEELGPLNETSNELRIGPSSVVIEDGGTTLFAALGGTRPYSYSVHSGTGTIDADTGIYTAPVGTFTTETISATDGEGASATATVQIVSADGALRIAPLTATIAPGDSIDFVVTGGSGSYTFTVPLPQNQSGSGPTPFTGTQYQAGLAEGNDIIEVVDDITGDSRLASVTTAVGTSNVDYAVDNVATGAFSTGGVAGQPLGILSAFEIENNGTHNGSKTVYWRLYFSDDGSLGPGDLKVDEGSIAGGLAAGAIATIDVSANWPVSIGPGSFFVHLSAQDDTALSNNQSSAIATTITAPDVQYVVSNIMNTGGAFAGQSLTGQFEVDNLGVDNGSASVLWFAYLSSDATLDAADSVFDTGSIAALAGGGGATDTFAGTWPSTAGTNYLIVEIAAVDDFEGADVAVSGAITTTVPDVNYQTSGLVHAGPDTVGAAFGGTFNVDQIGTDAGSANVRWRAFRSANATLDATDVVFDEGTLGALGAAPASAGVAYAGTWASSGTFYIIVDAVSDDDTNDTDGRSSAGPFTVTVPDVDYTVNPVIGGVVHSGGTLAGGGLSGTLMVQQTGGDAGSVPFYYRVYASADTTIGAGDKLIDSGNSPPLGSGGGISIPIGGQWPASTGTFYLLAELTAADDGNSGNDTGRSAGTVTTIEPQCDLEAVIVIVDPGQLTGGPASGTFTATNNGPHSAVSEVVYRIYLSDDATLDAGDTLLDSVSQWPFNNGDSHVLTWSGTWPLEPGNYNVIGEAVYDGDTIMSNNTSTAPITIVARNTDYVVDSMSITGASSAPTGAVTAEFQYRNLGADDGTMPLYWQAWASTDNVVDPAYDTLIDSGFGMLPLVSGALSAAVPVSGNWPLHYGQYYVLIRIVASDDINDGNNSLESTSDYSVGLPSEIMGEPNDDWNTLGNSFTIGPPLQPGMRIRVKGSMAAGDPDDVLHFNTGTANYVSFEWIPSSGLSQDIAILVMDGPASFPFYTAIPDPGNWGNESSGEPTVSVTWPVDAPGTDRWVDLENSLSTDVGNYYLMVTAF